jgi:hypothetical protein
MRTRIFDRFAELRTEREQLQAQLDALDITTARPADISLLDQLPLASNPLPRLTPELKALLFQALNLEILWNPADRQATVWAEITDTTLRAIPAILNPGHDGHHDTNPEHDPDQPTPACDFDRPPRTGTLRHRHRKRDGNCSRALAGDVPRTRVSSRVGRLGAAGGSGRGDFG